MNCFLIHSTDSTGIPSVLLLSCFKGLKKELLNYLSEAPYNLRAVVLKKYYVYYRIYLCVLYFL